MTHLRFSSKLLTVLILAMAFTSLAGAQNTRSWVSSTGLDANACTRIAPCGTFAGALSKTNTGGEINCVDGNDYGPVNITKAVTIDCGGTFGALLVPMSSIGIQVNAGSSDVVTLRNLSLNGGKLTGNVAIAYASAKAVHVENVDMAGFGNDCLTVSASAAALLTVDNATITDCGGSGIVVSTTSSTAVANINNTRISNTTIGVDADNGSRVTLRDSTLYFNNYGVNQVGAAGTSLGSVATIVNSTLGYSNIAALQSRSGQFILAFGNTFVNDVLVYNPNSGLIFTGADNNNSGSTPGTANGGTVPKI